MRNRESLKDREATDEFNSLIEKVSSADVTVYECLNASNDKESKAQFLENPELIHPPNEYGNLTPPKCNKILKF